MGVAVVLDYVVVVESRLSTRESFLYAERVDEVFICDRSTK